MLGLCLVGCGQYVLASSGSVADRIDIVLRPFGRVLTSFMAEVFARGVALGLGLLLLGALLVALGVGLPPADEREPPLAIHSRPWGSGSRGVAYGLAACVAVLAGVCGFALGQAAPGMGSVTIWLGMLAMTLVAAAAFDRIRHTRFGNPFPRRWEWAALLVLMGLDLVLVAHDLTHWRWAGTPDESYFFMTAKSIAEARLRPFPLSEDGVFGYHPLLSSYYQALFMKVFGTNVFGWRLSSAAALVMSLPLLYLLTRELWNGRAGFIAVVLFGTAQIAVGFSHLGYNNVQVYPVVLGALGVLAWSLRRRSLAGCYLAGCLASLGFYTFYSARLAAPLVILLAWSFGALPRRRGWTEILALAAGILLAALPVLVRPGEMMAHMLGQTALGGGQQLSLTSWGALAKVRNDWLLSVFYAPWSKCGWNFDWNPAVDPFAAAAAMVGLWLGVYALVRRSRAQFILPAYLLSAFVVGAISPYPCPPLTRLLTLAPFTAMLAAIALDRFMEWGARVVKLRRLVWLSGVSLVAAAVVWNVTALHRSIYHRHHGYGDGTTGELIRITLPLPEDCKLMYIQDSNNDSYNVDQVLSEYGLGERTTYIRPFGPQVEQTVDTLRPPFLMVYDLKRGEERRATEAAVGRRFPGVRWIDSAPGEAWNLRYCSVPGGVIAAR